MKTAGELVTQRIVVVRPEQRLKDVIGDIEARNALYCAVVEPSGRLVGLVRLAEIVAKSADRIFVDLVSASPPLDISDKLEGSLVVKLLQAQGRDELIVLGRTKQFVGLVTRESVFDWWVAQAKEK